MRIRIAVHRFRPDIGGTEQMAENLATAMVERGHTVDVVTLRTGATPARETISVPTGGAYELRRLDHYGERWRIPRGYWKALSAPADVVHVFGNRIWCSDFFLPIAPLLSARTVLTAQNFYQLYMHPGRLNDLYFRHYFPRMAEGVDAYVVQTRQEESQLRSFGYRGPISLIPHTVDPSEFDLPPDLGHRFRAAEGIGETPILLSTGGYAPNKRMDRVITAAARSATRWEVILVGRDWPGHAADLAHCRRQAAELGVPVRFLGEGNAAPRPQVLAAFAACTVYGQGSSYEGYGGAIQEAMLLGKPFVAFATGAVAEFAAAGAGYGVRTTEEFTAVLDRLGPDAELRRRLGEAGRTEVLRARSKPVVMDAYERLFRSLA